MSIIKDIRHVALEHSMPAEKAYGMARGLTAVRQTSLIEIETADGVVGVGEAWGPAVVTRAYLSLIAPYFIGREIYDVEQVWKTILAKHYHWGLQNQMTTCMSGIDVAARDAIGKTLGVPLYKLLGGRARDRVAIYASGGYITDDPDNPMRAQMERVAAAGHKAAKIKIGLSPESDEERVAIARDVLGDDVELMVDANGNYTLDGALASMERIEPYRIHWYEEPLAPQDVDGLRALHGSAPMPIATGEALYTSFEFKRLLDEHILDVAQPDISLCGGLGEARRIADLCHLAHTRISPHVWGSAVGLAAAAHFVASLPNYPHAANEPWPIYVEYDVGENALRDDLLRQPFEVADGLLSVPEGPGLGIEIDPAALDRYRISVA